MSSSLVKINHFVPLLTDTLPYEVPFFFSNRGFYDSLKKAYDVYFKAHNIKKAKGQKAQPDNLTLLDFFVKEYFKDNGPLQNLVQSASSGASIPYEYQIKKADKGHRSISLIHPIAQIKICDLYKGHKETILFYCGRSPYSIRYPSKITSRLVTKHANLLNNIFKEAEAANTSDLKEKIVEDHKGVSLSEVPSSYFVLEKYRMLHDFYDSSDLLDLEKRFQQCRHFDVKRCFESIYTHSISWAVKGKEYTKKNLSIVSKANPKPFEDEFDKLMQFSNYNETHGIPIGAEASRLFSEIILQKVDLNIQAAIENTPVEGKYPIKGQDFEIKRYMDDFFIFSNEASLSEKIQKICEHELKNYKLFANESKTVLLERPFVTQASSAKQKIKTLLWDYLDVFGAQKDKENASKRSPMYADSLRVINKIRGTIHDHKLSFYDVSNVALWILKKDLLDTLNYIQKQKKTEKISTGRIRGYLKNIIGIAFYIFYLSPRSHTTSTIFKIGYTILEILRVIEDDEIMGEIKQELSYQHLMFCERISNAKDENIVEFLDLILFLNELGDNFRIKEDRIKRIFKIKKTSEISYFESAVLLAYIKKDPAYAEVKNIVIESCCNKLTQDNALRKSENFLLFFDLIKCPYLEILEKNRILECVGIKLNKSADVISFIEGKEWFFDWNKQENLDLRSVLEIKEARLGY